MDEEYVQCTHGIPYVYVDVPCTLLYAESMPIDATHAVGLY